MNSLIGVVMLLLLVVIISAIAYAAFYLFPKKLKLIKKYGSHMTNDDFIDLAKNGNQEVKELVMKTKYVVVVVVIFGVVLVVLNHISKG